MRLARKLIEGMLFILTKRMSQAYDHGEPINVLPDQSCIWDPLYCYAYLNRPFLTHSRPGPHLQIFLKVKNGVKLLFLSFFSTDSDYKCMT